MVVNSTDITVTPPLGRFGQTIPMDSIETVNVLQTPFLAQYGRFHTERSRSGNAPRR